MARRKYSNGELQLEFNFPDDDSAADVNREIVPVARHIKELPVLPEGENLEFFDKIDILLQQIGECRMLGSTRLNAFILSLFYVEGKSVGEIAQLLSKGVEGVPCVTRERVRMIVAEIRDELLFMSYYKKTTKGITLRKEFVKEIAEYAVNHTGYVVKRKQVAGISSSWIYCFSSPHESRSRWYGYSMDQDSEDTDKREYRKEEFICTLCSFVLSAAERSSEAV